MSSRGLADQECPPRSRARLPRLLAAGRCDDPSVQDSKILIDDVVYQATSSPFGLCLSLPPLSLSLSLQVRYKIHSLPDEALRRIQEPLDTSSCQVHVSISVAFAMLFGSLKVSAGGEREAAPDHERHEAAGNKNRPASPLCKFEVSFRLR